MTTTNPSAPEPDRDELWLRLLRDRFDYGRAQPADLVSLWSQATGTWRGLRAAFDFLGSKGPLAPPAFVSDFIAQYATRMGAKTLLDPFAGPNV